MAGIPSASSVASDISVLSLGSETLKNDQHEDEEEEILAIGKAIFSCQCVARAALEVTFAVSNLLAFLP